MIEDGFEHICNGCFTIIAPATATLTGKERSSSTASPARRRCTSTAMPSTSKA